ncbi:hypothetical protein ACFXBC_26020, partial [Streptomyces sp. NPDC059398]
MAVSSGSESSHGNGPLPYGTGASGGPDGHTGAGVGPAQLPHRQGGAPGPGRDGGVNHAAPPLHPAP